MTTERINPAELARPSGFSHAVAATGRMVFLAGQTGVDRDGNVAGGGVVPQFERALTSLLTALGAAGGLPSDLVSLTIYLTDVPDYQAHAREIGAVWRRLPSAHGFQNPVRLSCRHRPAEDRAEVDSRNPRRRDAARPAHAPVRRTREGGRREAARQR